MSNGKDRYDLELEIVEFVDEGENKYGIKAVAILKKNKSPEDGAEIEFFVSGAPVGNAKGAGVSGELKYFEPTTKQMCLKSTDAHGVATIKIPLGDKEQKTFIFPAERPGDQVEKEIPSQQEESKKTEPICVEETKISISERWRAAVERGRQKARGGK